MRRLETERILRRIGAANHGVATRAQLVLGGLSAHAVDHMVRGGRLIVLRRGLYQIGPLPANGWAEAAAVLGCGPDGRLSHSSAATKHDLLASGPTHRSVEVTVPRNRRPRIPGVRIHRARDLWPDEVTTIEGLPVTTPARTLLDIGDTLRAREVEQALATALRRRLVTKDEMRAMVDRHPRHPGAAILRRLLDDEAGPSFTRSEAEERLLEITRSAGLRRPELNVTVLGHEVDFLWRSERVIAEADGYAFHASERSFAADRRRDAELTAAGYRALRFTWEDLNDGGFATVVRLAQALVR